MATLEEEWNEATPVSLEEEWKNAEPLSEKETMANIPLLTPAQELAAPTTEQIKEMSTPPPRSEFGEIRRLPPGVAIPSDKITIPEKVPLVGGTTISPTEILSNLPPGVPQLRGEMPWLSEESGMNIGPLVLGPLVKGAGTVAGIKGIPKVKAPEVVPSVRPEIPGPTLRDFADVFRKTPTVREVVEKGLKKGTPYSLKGRPTSAMEEVQLKRGESMVRDIVGMKDQLKYMDSSGNVSEGRVPESLRETEQAITQAKSKLFKEYHEPVARATGAGLRISPTSTADLLNKMAESDALSLEPNLRNYCRRMADEITRIVDKGGYSPTDLEKQIARLNEKTNIQQKNPSYNLVTRSQIDAGIAQDLRMNLDDAISSADVKYQELKNRYGAVRAWEDEIHKASVRDSAKPVKGVFDIIDAFSTYHILRGLLTGDIPHLVAGVGARGTTAYLKWRNNPNRYIARMFHDAERAIELENRGRVAEAYGRSKYGKMPMGGPPLLLPWEPLPNLPVPFKERVTGYPVPTGEGVGVEHIPRKRLGWRTNVPTQEPPLGPLSLPPGISFTLPETPGTPPRSVITPEGKRLYGHQYGPGATPYEPIRKTGKWGSRKDLSWELNMAKRARDIGTPTSVIEGRLRDRLRKMDIPKEQIDQIVEQWIKGK